VYIPLFATHRALIPVFLLVFACLTGLWCMLGYYLTHHPLVRERLKKYGRIIVPLILAGIGLKVIGAQAAADDESIPGSRRHQNAISDGDELFMNEVQAKLTVLLALSHELGEEHRNLAILGEVFRLVIAGLVNKEIGANWASRFARLRNIAAA
jgi:hypothetical protein